MGGSRRSSVRWVAEITSPHRVLNRVYILRFRSEIAGMEKRVFWSESSGKGFQDRAAHSHKGSSPSSKTCDLPGAPRMVRLMARRYPSPSIFLRIRNFMPLDNIHNLVFIHNCKLYLDEQCLSRPWNKCLIIYSLPFCINLFCNL